MIFKKLKLTNIRSYKELELEFPKGSILLSGDVGVGKTSILLALQFALFGLQPGQKGASILRHDSEKASVQLEIEINGKQVILERSLKRGKSITQELNSLTIDGEKQELSTSEMKNKVIEMLEYPKEFAKKSNLLYKFTVYTPQEEMKAIIQERPEIRLDTLRHIFGIDRYRRIKENSQTLLQKVKELIKIKETEIREINILKEKFTQKTENKIKLAKEINDLEIKYKRTLDLKKESEKKLKLVEEKIEQKRILDSNLNRKNAELEGKKILKQRFEKEISTMQTQVKEKIDFSEQQLNEVVNLLQKHRNSFKELNDNYFETNTRISVLNSDKENKLQLKDKVVSLDNCPTCFQSVGQEHKEKISKRVDFSVDDINRELEQKIIQKDQLIKDIENEKRLIEEYESDKQKLEQNKIRFQHQKIIETKIKSDFFVLERTQKETQELENEIQDIKERIQGFSENENQFEKEKTEFENLNSQVRNLEILLAEKNKEIQLLKISLMEIDEEIKNKEKIKSQVNYLRTLQDWLEEKFLSVVTITEKNIMAKLRRDFSEIFQEWFSILVSDSLSARLDEDFTPIVSQQDYEIDYDFLSGGERTAVALAYRLALNQVLNSMLSKIKTKDILILDEPTDGFSEQQLDKMRDIFEQIKSKQIILVSHEPKIESFVDNVIKIKKDGVSGVDEEV